MASAEEIENVAEKVKEGARVVEKIAKQVEDVAEFVEEGVDKVMVEKVCESAPCMLKAKCKCGQHHLCTYIY